MSAKRFCFVVFSASISILLLLLVVNYFVDTYGLFRNAKGRSISIYSDERTAKYLLAHKYVPENFEGYILGPSLSANLDPKKIAEYRIYNLSMMGANITEQKVVVEKAMEKSIPRFVIICLHPYLTFDHGMKSAMINTKEYYGALGSVSLYKSYMTRIVRHFDLMPAKFPANQFNDYGANHYNVLLQKMPVADKIKEQLTLDDAIKTDIDTTAWNEFNELIDEFKKNNVQVITYFHPLPYLIYDKFRAPLQEYQNKMTAALEGKAAVMLDFNAPKYEFFTKDLSNYIDHGHLSDQGESYLLREIITLSHPAH